MNADHDLPPEPDERHITAAPEDYAKPAKVMHVVWPTMWLVVAAALFLVVRHAGWPVFPGH